MSGRDRDLLPLALGRAPRARERARPGGAAGRASAPPGVACGIKPSRRPRRRRCSSATRTTPTSAALFTRNAVRRGAGGGVAAGARSTSCARSSSTPATRTCATARAGSRPPRRWSRPRRAALGVEPDAGRRRVDRRDRRSSSTARRSLTGIDRPPRELSQAGGAATSPTRSSTTDRWPKRASLEVELAGRHGARCAPGQGRRHDLARLRDHALLRRDRRGDRRRRRSSACCGAAVARSFDRISRRRPALDQRLGLHDRGRRLGRRGASPAPSDELLFAQALDALLRQLALEIVADGEGADARRAPASCAARSDAVEPVARAVATSPLVKTRACRRRPQLGPHPAGGGPACCRHAAGRRSTSRSRTSQVARAAAMPSSSTSCSCKRRRAGDGRARGRDRPRLGRRRRRAEIFFCDLGHDYVTLNAEYTT